MRKNYLFKKLDPENAAFSTKKKDKLKRDFLKTASLGSTNTRFSGWASNTAKFAYGAGVAVFVISIASLSVFGSTTSQLHTNSVQKSKDKSAIVAYTELQEQKSKEEIAQNTEHVSENTTDVQGVHTENNEENKENQSGIYEDQEYPIEQQCVDPNNEDKVAISLNDALVIAKEFYNESQVHQVEFEYEEGVGYWKVEYENHKKVLVNSCSEQAFFEDELEHLDNSYDTSDNITEIN